jgi:antitoxin (DNA-binding transcriptional repressor) of toxin-antitoxin stability system
MERGKGMAQSEVKTVGVREFRENFSEHLMSNVPIAVTKHGLTVGYYIPTHRPVSQVDKQALAEATKQLSDMLEAEGLDPEALIREAISLRKKDKRKQHV